MHTDTTFTDILARWPTHRALAADMGVTKHCVRQWKTRNFVHPRYWPRLIEMTEQRFGVVITPGQLMRAAADRSASETTEAEAA